MKRYAARLPVMLKIGSRSDAVRMLRYWTSRDPAPRVFSRDAWLVLAVTVVWYAVAYAVNDQRPSFDASRAHQGWNGGWDQGQYLLQTTQLAHGEIKPGVYWIGYPALGALFFWLLPAHPYLIPDFAAVLAMVAVFYAAGRTLMSRLEAVLLVYVFVWFDSFLREVCLVEPWNTIPAYAAFFVCIYFFVFRREPLRLAHFGGGAVLCGVAMLARPTEIVALGILYAAGLARLAGWKQRVGAAAIFCGIAGLAGAVILGLNLHFYQSWRSPYMGGELGKVNAANYGLKAWQFFYDGTFLTGGGVWPTGARPPALFTRYPEFLLVLPGLFLLVRRNGMAGAGFVGAILFTLGFYLLYIPFGNAPYAWSYSQWHYVAWMMPWLGLATYAGLREGWRYLPRWRFAGALLLPLALAVVLGFRASRCGHATRDVSDRMAFTTSQEPGAFVIEVECLAPCRAEDLRLNFSLIPPFNGTQASNVPFIHVLRNEHPLAQMADYMESQDKDTFHISFLAHGLPLKAGDRLTVRLDVGTHRPALASAELVDIRYAPLQALRDYFTP